MWDCGISRALAMEMLQSCTGPSIYSVRAGIGCLTGTLPLSCLYLCCPNAYPRNPAIGNIEMAACVKYECHMEAHRSSSLDAGLCYLWGVSSGDAVVMNWTIKNWVWAMAWCLSGIRPPSTSMITLCIPKKVTFVWNWNNSMCDYNREAYISKRLDTWLQYLRCVDNEDAELSCTNPSM